MMKIRSLIVAMFAVAGMVSANAATQTSEFDAFTLTYDDSSIFGGTSFSFSSSDNVVGFGWNQPNTLQLPGAGFSQFNLPTFTITGKSGYSLSGFSVSLGNLPYLSIDGFLPLAHLQTSTALDSGTALSGNVGLNVIDDSGVPSNTGALTYGHLSASESLTSNSYQTLTFEGTLNLISPPLTYILPNEQGKLSFSMIAAPVPEPETYAMLLAGLGLMGAIVRRRKQNQG